MATTQKEDSDFAAVEITEEDHPRPSADVSMRELNPLVLENRDPRQLGNCLAFSYYRHNPIFTIGPNCTSSAC